MQANRKEKSMDAGKDKVVLITGGGGGIARGYRARIRHRGCEVHPHRPVPRRSGSGKGRSLSAISAPKCSRFSRTDRWKRRCGRGRSGRRALRRAHRRPDQQRAGIGSVGIDAGPAFERRTSTWRFDPACTRRSSTKHAYPYLEGDGGIRHQLRFRRGHRRQSRTELLRCGERGASGA